VPRDYSRLETPLSCNPAVRGHSPIALRPRTACPAAKQTRIESREFSYGYTFTFDASRIYVRAYAHLICIGAQ